MEEFEKMLKNMNLSEEKKEPLRMLPISKNRDMLNMNNKTVARNKFDSPQTISGTSPIQRCLLLRNNNSLEWVQDFGNKELKQVLSVLNECFRKYID
jgi:phenylalanyl-tRNA synthetase alpha subunit